MAVSEPAICDLTDLGLFDDGLPHVCFRRLMEEAPVYWNPESEPDEPGFWAITRHEDVAYVSKHPNLFSNREGHYISYRAFGIRDPEAVTVYRNLLLSMDPPEHRFYRKLHNPAFAPKIIRGMENRMRERVHEILDGIATKGECDFVSDVATVLPLWTLCHVLGVPLEDRDDIITWSNQIIALQDPDYFASPEEGQAVFGKLVDYGKRLMAERRANPQNDLMSIMAHAQTEDGESLPEPILDAFFLLMVVAGNETTRNTIGGGMRALSEFPQQKRKLVEDPSLIPNAVEEMLRYVSAIIYMRRTAIEDTSLRGQPIRAGDKVVMWYGAANFDPAVFDHPYDFDVTRPNARDHLAFGIGEHFCLGAQLARLQIRVMYEELLKRFPDMEVAGEPRYLRSNHLNGLKSLPVRFTPERCGHG